MPSFEKGQRERLDLCLIEFEAFEFERESFEQDLYSHEETKPSSLNSILDKMDEFYTQERREYLGDAINTQNSTVFTMYEPKGVWALEYHDEDTLTVQIKEVHREDFLSEIRNNFNVEVYEKMGIDPEEVIEAAPR